MGCVLFERFSLKKIKILKNVQHKMKENYC